MTHQSTRFVIALLQIRRLNLFTSLPDPNYFIAVVVAICCTSIGVLLRLQERGIYKAYAIGSPMKVPIHKQNSPGNSETWKGFPKRGAGWIT
jgi:hypothetical protein